MNTTTFQITVPATDVSMLKKLIAGMEIFPDNK